MIFSDYINNKDIIFSMITPPGEGGISVLRVSGKGSKSIARKLCPTLPKILETHKVYYTKARYVDNSVIDECLVSGFFNGKSFTAEECFELSCHGSLYIVSEIQTRLLDFGARQAKSGEFSLRAFCNGRIDLVQAEGILSLIQSDSKRSQRIALRQLEGNLSKQIISIIDRITDALAHIEASIDFSEEDLPTDHREALSNKLQLCFKDIKKLVVGFKVGKTIKDGIKTVFFGATNVGKSSIFNALLNSPRSIISNVEGTTRDVIDASLFINSHKFQMFDTAGLRGSDDVIEQMGVARTKSHLEDADVKVLVIDGSASQETIIENLRLHGDFRSKSQNDRQLEKEKLLIFINKSDLYSKEKRAVISDWVKDFTNSPVFFGSTVEDGGIQELHDGLLALTQNHFQEHNALISHTRHFEALCSSMDFLEKSLNLLKKEQSIEFIAFELHAALASLYEMLGQSTDEKVLDRVFSNFCLGK